MSALNSASVGFNPYNPTVLPPAGYTPDWTGAWLLNLDALAHTLVFDGSGNLITDTAADAAGNTWVQTFTYLNGETLYTGWVKQ